MFYINTRKKLPKLKEKQVLDILIIPPEERTYKDHQAIYHDFADHPLLSELERSKSLNARVKCIAALQLISRELFLPDHHIPMRYFEDERVAVLPTSIKMEAEKYNEKQIRQKFDQLTPFAVMQSLKYDELFYLAYHLEFACYKYKDYLYRQGDPPDYLYLIQEGEFHYVKETVDGQNQMAVLKRKRKRQKATHLKSIEADEDSPNKYVKAQTNRYRVGIVEGKLGQCLGLEEIVLQAYREARQYTVICNCTDNRVLKIHKSHLETILEELPHFKEQLVRQTEEANCAKLELFKRIKETKHNLKDYIKHAGLKAEEPQKEQAVHLRSSQDLQEDVNMSRYHLPVVEKKSSISYQYKSRAFSSALTTSLQAEEQRMRSMKSESNLEIEESDRYQEANLDGTFAITAVRQPLPRPKLLTRFSDMDRQHNEPSFQLPSIAKKTSEYLEGESLNVKSLGSKSRSKLNQYSGLIDSSLLVREKQHIMDRKITRKTRKDLFPAGHIEFNLPRSTEAADPMKLKASPAHSNRFMEKLLLKVLKKAGYDETKEPPPSKVESKTVNVKSMHPDFYRSISRSRKKETAKTKNDDNLLVSSAFDECYFSKL